jgi:hypothetical protein
MSVATQVSKSVVSAEQAVDLVERMKIESTTDLGDILIHVGQLDGEDMILIAGTGPNACVINL